MAKQTMRKGKTSTATPTAAKVCCARPVDCRVAYSSADESNRRQSTPKLLDDRRALQSPPRSSLLRRSRSVRRSRPRLLRPRVCYFAPDSRTVLTSSQLLGSNLLSTRRRSPRSTSVGRRFVPGPRRKALLRLSRSCARCRVMMASAGRNGCQ